MNSDNAKILIIDDEPAILDALGAFLRHAGYKTETITEYKSHLEKVDEDSLPDLIILDILLMDEDGRKIAQTIRKEPLTKNTPIIMISAHPKADKTALKAGANVFMSKPFEAKELLTTIKRLLSSS